MTPPSTSPPTPPQTIRTFLDLIKFAHSVFALPFALVAATMALRANPPAGVQQIFTQLALILGCMVSARTYAMTVNRLLDRRLDARNPRTARRPSVTGEVSSELMVVAISVSGAAFILATAGFWWLFDNPWPVILALPVLLWLGGYSLTKRFTWLCHFWLGISLGIAPVAAWIALTPPQPHGPVLVWPVVWLGSAVVFWVTGFDILYALQDEGIDRAEGLHSVPALLGRRGALWVSRGCHVLAAGALVLVGLSQGGQLAAHPPGVLYWVGTGLAAGLLLVEQSLVSPRDISRINIAFMTINGIVGVVYGTLAIVDLLVR
ncbi:MAG: UbiA-like polyprenyltransferase [Phycisphaerae bacterium]